MPSKLRLLLPLLALLCASLACGVPFLQAAPTPAGTIRPKFTNFTPPALQINLKPFSDAGCKPDADGKLRCPPNLPPFDQVGCFDISAASPLLGGLAPAYPLMLCSLDTQPGQEPPAGQFLYSQGCTDQTYFRLVIFKDGQLQAIKNIDELKQVYAPIDTPDEALAYAIAATGFDADYGLKDDNLRYLVNTLSDTYVETTSGGYAVHLYNYDLCGCGPHSTNARRVNITRAGDIDVDDPQPVWQDPSQDELCVD